MNSTYRMLSLFVLFAVTWAPTTVMAQNVQQDRKTWAVDDGDWSNGDNWTDDFGPLAGAPSLGDETWAQIGRNATVTVDDDSAGALLLQRGTVFIPAGKKLKVDKTDFTDGLTTIDGSLVITGNGSFEGLDLDGSGLLHLGGPDASLSLTGNMDFGGEIRLGITGDGAPTMNVGGDAVLSGTVAPEFDGVQPGLGTSFDFITGANSVNLANASLSLPESTSLPRGVGAVLQGLQNKATFSIRNLPILTIDRATGDTSISNVVGDTLGLTGYSLVSANGLLTPEGWSSLASQGESGWEETANPGEALGEMNSTTAVDLAAGAAGLSIGKPYKSGNIHPDSEDVEFLVSLSDGSELNGIVEYIGAPNNLTLRVDPTTGEAEISHQSNFVGPFEVTGYSILSGSGALDPSAWSSITNATGDDSWIIANPGANAIAEFSASSMSVFATGTEHALGKIFTPGGVEDLVFEFATAGGDTVVLGTVEYGPLDAIIGGGCTPANALAGDLDGNGTVEFADFLVLAENFGQQVSAYSDGDVDCNGTVQFADFLTLAENFGKSVGAQAAAVPEPSGWALLGLGIIGVLTARRRQR